MTLILDKFCVSHVRLVKLFKMLRGRIAHFHTENDMIESMASMTLNGKSRRRPFPEDVSETMVRLILWRLTGVMPTQNPTGDLTYFGKIVEVKTFISDGPSSFGPTESWDVIYFFDLSRSDQHRNQRNDQRNDQNRDQRNDQNRKTYVTLYKIPLKMESEEWQNIKVNKLETMADQQRSKRRPRISFSNLQKQLAPHHISIAYEGFFEDLLL